MKKLIASSDSLKSSLKLLSKAVNSKHTLPVLKNVYLKVTKGELEMITSDTELTISTKISAETSGEPFELLIPFDFINSIVSLVRSAPITIEHPSTRKASIIDSQDVYRLESLDKLEDLPSMPRIPKENTLKVDKDFVSILSKAMHSVAKGEVKYPALTKACLDIGKSESNLVSTDLQVLYKHKVVTEGKAEDKLLFSSKLAKALEGMDEMEIFWSDKKIVFKSGNITIWNTRQEEKYPDYKKIIPGYEPNITLEHARLVDALNKSCLASQEAIQTTVNLKSEAGKIFFVTDDIDYGRKISVAIPGTYTGPVDHVVINPQKFLTLIEQVDVDQIRLHIEDATKSVVVTSEEDTDFLGLVIPYNLNKV